MIDYIYGVTQPDLEALGPVAKAIFGYSVSSLAGREVRYRRYRLANLIDSLAVAKVHSGATRACGYSAWLRVMAAVTLP